MSRLHNVFTNTNHLPEDKQCLELMMTDCAVMIKQIIQINDQQSTLSRLCRYENAHRVI